MPPEIKGRILATVIFFDTKYWFQKSFLTKSDRTPQILRLQPPKIIGIDSGYKFMKKLCSWDARSHRRRKHEVSWTEIKNRAFFVFRKLDIFFYRDSCYNAFIAHGGRYCDCGRSSIITGIPIEKMSSFRKTKDCSIFDFTPRILAFSSPTAPGVP